MWSPVATMISTEFQRRYEELRVEGRQTDGVEGGKEEQ